MALSKQDMIRWIKQKGDCEVAQGAIKLVQQNKGSPEDVYNALTDEAGSLMKRLYQFLFQVNAEELEAKIDAAHSPIIVTVCDECGHEIYGWDANKLRALFPWSILEPIILLQLKPEKAKKKS